MDFDEVGEALCIGQEYILFLNSPHETEAVSIFLDETKTEFYQYYTLVTGKSSVFEVFNENLDNSSVMMYSLSKKHVVAKEIMLQIANEK